MFFRKILLDIVAAIFLSFCGIKSNICIVDNFNSLKEESTNIDKDVLVCFDVDRTLIDYSSIIFRDRKENRAIARKEIWDPKKHLSNEKSELLSYKIMLEEPMRLIDTTLPALFDTLREKNAKIIALTAMGTGIFCEIQHLEDFRINELKNLGLDFSASFSDKPFITLFPSLLSETIPLGNKSSPALFKEGIIFSVAYDKGNTLKTFFDAINWKPKRIIFIDDHMSNVESVAKAAQDVGVSFLGLCYQGAQKYVPFVDEKLAKFQAKYFFEHEEWLPDSVARGQLECTATG